MGSIVVVCAGLGKREMRLGWVCEVWCGLVGFGLGTEGGNAKGVEEEGGGLELKKR